MGPIVVFSAPMGCTDELIKIGESYAHSQCTPMSLESVFGIYARLASVYVSVELRKQALDELANFESLTQADLDSVNKRLSGSVKARILTLGGELAMSTLMDYVLKSNGLDSCHVSLEEWPIVTDDNFEDATPNYELSKNKVQASAQTIKGGKDSFFGRLLRNYS